jgi:hypothetical protein
MAFDIKGYYEASKDYYGDVPLEDVAKDVFSRGGYDQKYPSYDDWKKDSGVQDHIDYENLQKSDAERDKPSGMLRRMAGDPLVSAAKGIVGAGEFSVGLANIATGGTAGKALEQYAGYQPKAAQSYLDDMYSYQQREANRKVSEADGFIPSLVTSLENPSTIAHSVIQSMPSMLGGGAVARQIMKSPAVGGKLIKMFGKKYAPVANIAPIPISTSSMVGIISD